VTVERLQVAFGDGAVPVVQDVSFTIAPGECLALVGESGSGKSVTARSLVGLAGSGAAVQAGQLTFDGADLTQVSQKEWRRLRGRQIGFVLQDALGSLDPLRRIGSEVSEPLRIHDRLGATERRQRAIDLLHRAGVPRPEQRAEQLSGQLSGGLRQRALIASAIACAPRLLIADEPTTALDAAVQAQILDLLRQLRDAGTALLLISHDLAVVASLADRIAVMRGGRIVEQGPAQAILHAPRDPYTRRLVDAARTIHGGARPTQVVTRLPSSTPLCEVRDVAKAFPAWRGGTAMSAVAGVTLTIHAGETLGLVGQSGCGKTTVARILLGLETPDRGTVLWRGQDRRAVPLAERRRVQVVFQDPLASFDPRYTVWRVIDEALALASSGAGRSERRARAADLLEKVRLDPALLDRRPIELSGGQRQRIAIARAIASEPDLLVCDEPVSALDVSVQADVLALLDELKARLGIACLFISHDLGVVRRVSDRLAVMQDGLVVEEGDADEVFAQPRHAYTRSLLAAIPPLETQARFRA
jgi:peptide/nickel transport system ATP-binding protein